MLLLSKIIPGNRKTKSFLTYGSVTISRRIERKMKN